MCWCGGIYTDPTEAKEVLEALTKEFPDKCLKLVWYEVYDYAVWKGE